MEPSVRTNAVAADILTEVSSFFETPINGHRPKIFVSTILLTKTIPMSNTKYSFMQLNYIGLKLKHEKYTLFLYNLKE